MLPLRKEAVLVLVMTGFGMNREDDKTDIKWWENPPEPPYSKEEVDALEEAFWFPPSTRDIYAFIRKRREETTFKTMAERRDDL
jgi:hypothetical protein